MMEGYPTLSMPDRTVSTPAMFSISNETRLIVSLVFGFVLRTRVVASSFRIAETEKTTLALLASLKYVMWKLPMYMDFFKHRETRCKKDSEGLINVLTSCILDSCS